MEKGTVYFFTGLAGAGKTTIGGLFYRRLKEKKPNVVMLDGDQLRRLSTNKYSGYSTEERRKGAFYNFETWYCAVFPCTTIAAPGPGRT